MTISCPAFYRKVPRVIVTPRHLLASALLLSDLLLHSFRLLLASKNQFLFCKELFPYNPPFNQKQHGWYRIFLPLRGQVSPRASNPGTPLRLGVWSWGTSSCIGSFVATRPALDDTP